VPINYQQVVPWGRSFEEYVRMFRLTNADLRRRILGCGDGPAAFNAGMNLRGWRATSVDPMYFWSRAQIEARIQETREVVLEQTGENRHLFRWTEIKDLEALGKLRMAAMQEFLGDYDDGLKDGRYVTGELPTLPFPDGTFDLVLCSHFLFLYSDHLDLNFHLRAIEEMLRVGSEVRLFPIHGMNAEVSCHLAGVMSHWGKLGSVELVSVDYEFQVGANQMLAIRKANADGPSTG